MLVVQEGSDKFSTGAAERRPVCLGEPCMGPKKHGEQAVKIQMQPRGLCAAQLRIECRRKRKCWRWKSKVINHIFSPSRTYACIMYHVSQSCSQPAGCAAQYQCKDGPAHTQLTSPLTSTHTPASTHAPLVPRWWLAPGRWTHSDDRPSLARLATLQKKKLQLEVPHPAKRRTARQRRIGSWFPEAPHKIYEPLSRFQFPSPSMQCCTYYCTHWPGVDC